MEKVISRHSLLLSRNTVGVYVFLLFPMTLLNLVVLHHVFYDSRQCYYILVGCVPVSFSCLLILSRIPGLLNKRHLGDFLLGLEGQHLVYHSVCCQLQASHRCSLSGQSSSVLNLWCFTPKGC
jgi:hypothetical protein